MMIEVDIKAKIVLTGRDVVKSGYRPAHLIGDYYTTGLHQYIGTDTLNKGESVIKLHSAEKCSLSEHFLF